MTEKNFTVESHHLSKNDYLKINWMNVVPELVCDILNYMCNYIHLRSNKISKDAYEAMLQGQIQKLPVSTVKQL